MHDLETIVARNAKRATVRDDKTPVAALANTWGVLLAIELVLFGAALLICAMENNVTP